MAVCPSDMVHDAEDTRSFAKFEHQQRPEIDDMETSVYENIEDGFIASATSV